jgi:hypothetical protein
MLRPVSSLVRACGITTLLLGFGLAAWSLWRAAVLPLPLVVALILTGVVLAALGVGVGRAARAAWAFALAILGVLGLAGVLAVPAIVRSGFPAPLAGLVLALIAGLFGALIMGRDAWRGG